MKTALLTGISSDIGQAIAKGYYHRVWEIYELVKDD
jgi:NAD(P)-dependent dehydrogenase (short-subunit alcohol dehydrogenase family)